MSSNLELVDVDAALVDSRSVVLHCGLFVKCHSVYTHTHTDISL